MSRRGRTSGAGSRPAAPGLSALVWLGGLLSVLALLVAGCGGGTGGETATVEGEAGGDAGAGSGGSSDAASEGGGGVASGDASGDASGEPITVGVVTSTSGFLGSYGTMYVEGLEAGLDHATDGTGAVDGRPVELEVVDDGGDPEQAISAATDLVGRGVNVLMGTVSSGVAIQMAPFAAENDVLYISGPAATDAVTGINRNTFRSGRQTYQDVAAAASLLEGGAGDVLVIAQDSEFGQGNVAAVEAVLGGQGASVDSILVPLTAQEFTPFAQQVVDAAPDLLFVAWAGDTTAAFFTALQQQGAFEATTVTTGLGDRNAWATYGADPSGVEFLAHYFAEAPDTEVNAALADAVGGTPDIFHPDGFVAGQMLVRALSEGDPDDVSSMVDALEGWTFDAPKGEQTVRAGDHAMLQPMFTARIEGEPGSRTAELLDTLAPDAVAPPEAGAE